jgi:PAS domain S-box-containing protein
MQADHKVPSKTTRVLLIEDNPGDARLIKEMLRDARGNSFHLEHTDNLTLGLERLQKGGIDVVLLDLALPDSRGIDTFTRLHAKATDLPVILLTGLDDEVIAVQAIKEGAQDYLVKGQIDSILLERAIRYAMERHRILEELKTANQKILEHEKLSVLVETAGATAHELNQPLSVIIPRIDMILAETDKQDPHFTQMNKIREQCMRMAELVHKISQISTYETKPYIDDVDIIDLDKAAGSSRLKDRQDTPRNLMRSFLTSLNQYSTIITDLDGKISYFNKYSEELLGYSAKEVVNKKDVLFFSKMEGSRKGMADYRAKAIQQGCAEREKTIITKAGKEVDIDLCYAPLKDSESKITAFVGIARPKLLRTSFAMR